MKRKLVVRYVLLCLPFVCGAVLYGIGSYNIVSSLLFFVGGYVGIKNLCDYRKIMKNIKLVTDKSELEFKNINDDMVDTKERGINNDIEISKKIDSSVNNKINKYNSCEDIPGIKRTRVYKRVRRRY